MNVPSFASDAPLIQAPVSEGKLYDGFSAVYRNAPLEDSHWVARMGSRIGVMVTSSLGSVTFIPVSLPLGKWLGPVCAASNFATFLVVDYWSAKGMIHEAFGPKTQAEIALTQDNATRNGSTCKKVVLISSAFLIALLAQVPYALATMEYNEEKYKVTAGIVLLVSGAILPLRSLLLSLEQIALKAQGSQESTVTELKEGFINLLSSSHEAFIKQSLQEKDEFIRSLPTNTDDRTLLLLQQGNESSSSRVQTVCNYAGLGLGVALAALFEYTSADYTFVQTGEEINKNKFVGGVFAALAVASTAYLIGLSIIKTTQSIFTVCGNAIEGNETRNLSWQLRPKLSAGLTAFALLINIAALGPNYEIWGSFYTKSVEHELFPSGVCLAIFLLFFTSSLDIIDDIVVASLAKGTEEEKKLLQVSEEFKKLVALVGQCSDHNFMVYLTRAGVVPRAMRAKLGTTASPLRERDPLLLL